MNSVIAFDVDGTLLNSNGGIHPADVAMLLDPPPGVLFVPSTGRPLNSINKLFRANRMWLEQPIPLPMSLQNGSVLYRPNEIVLFEAGFEPDVQSQLVAIARELPSLTFNFFTRDEIFTLWLTDFSADLLKRFGLNAQPLDENSCLKSFTKLTADCADPEMLNIFAGATNNLELEHSVNIGLVHEINPPGVNKGSGLQKLLTNIGVQPTMILAAGDSGNDLRLFERADLSFAPKTSAESIQREADYVIDVEHEGLLTPILLRVM